MGTISEAALRKKVMDDVADFECLRNAHRPGAVLDTYEATLACAFRLRMMLDARQGPATIEVGFSDWLRAKATACHANSKAKGFWDPAPNFPQQIALMHSELSEALEAWREGQPINQVLEDKGNGKVFGVPVELADCVIRILDTCAAYDIDLADAIERKMRYNEARPHRHGGKLA